MPDTIRLARLTLRWVASGDLYEANLRNNNHCALLICGSGLPVGVSASNIR